LTTAYPEVSLEELELLDIFEIRELLVASCVANGLEVEYMIDPNFLDPKVLEAAAEGDPTAGQKTTSLEDSGDSDTQSQS
jgi:hypothetical protein